MQPPIEKNPSALQRRSVRADILYGAKFGAVVAGSIMGCVGLCGLLFFSRYDYSKLSLLNNIGGFLGGTLMSAFYGAATGALICGVRAYIRHRKSKLSERGDD